LSSWSAWAAGGAFFLAGLFPLFNADAYGHLAQGRQIVALGRVPKVDLFSFWKSEPQRWSNYEWGYDWLSWLAYDHLGANALILAKCAALGVLGYLLVALAFRLSRGVPSSGPIALTALLLALPVARFRFTVRPQIVGLVFPAILLTGIGVLYSESASSRRKAWTLAGLAVLHLLWVNMHGSHLLGVVIAALFAAFAVRTPALRWMVGLVALQLAATACTPFGLGIASDAISHVLRPEYRELVVEWSAWSPKDPIRLLAAPVVTALFVLVAMRPVVRGSRFGLAYGALCVVLSIMAFRSMRFVAHQLLFCAPFIAAGLSQLPALGSLRRGWVALAGAAALFSLLWTTQLVPALGFGFGEPKREYPWASADVIDRAVHDPRIVASLQDSWVLMFAAPSAKLLIDGRVPFYGPDMIRDVGRSFADPARFAEQLEGYGVNTVVIDHTRADHIPATEYLDTASHWNLVFVEDGHSLFVRTDALKGIAPFRVIGPGYRTGRLLDVRFTDDELRAEAARLDAKLNTSVMQAWHRGIELLRPLARDGARAGVRKYSNGEERRTARAAYERLSAAAERFPGFTAIELYRAMAALAACDVPQARGALGRATYAGQTRESSLVGLELSLRGGDSAERTEGKALLAQLLEAPESRTDPWVRAIAADVAVRCP
jgi:hypothetical protein